MLRTNNTAEQPFLRSTRLATQAEFNRGRAGFALWGERHSADVSVATCGWGTPPAIPGSVGWGESQCESHSSFIQVWQNWDVKATSDGWSRMLAPPLFRCQSNRHRHRQADEGRGHTGKDIAKHLGVSRVTLYR